MNKKYISIAIIAACLSACTKSKSVEFDVTVKDLTDGVIAVKNQGTQTVFGDNIKNGKSDIKGYLEENGFYELQIVKPNQLPMDFEIYLEPGKYTINSDASNLGKYPKIVSESKKQQEISDYYAIYDDEVGSARLQATKLDKEISENGSKLSKDAYRNLAVKIDDAQEKARSAEFVVLEKYVKKYPQSELAAHFMAKQPYTDYPEKYQKLYSTLSEAAKSSDDGKEIGQKLSTNMKLLPGKKAPALEGKTFDGKTFAAITAGKKLFLIDFWRSVNQVSRTNHDDIKNVYQELKGQGFEVISVSLDSKPLWWSTAVKDDKLPWPQMSDLKGNDSPNAANWNIIAVPTYYLVDANWNIYMKDIAIGSIKLEATQYLEKH